MRYSVFFLFLIVLSECGFAEGFRKGTIYIQPVIVETADDRLDVHTRIENDLKFTQRIYSQIGITIKKRPVIVLGARVSVVSKAAKNRRVSLSEKFSTLPEPIFRDSKTAAVTIYYVPPIVHAKYDENAKDSGKLQINLPNAVRGYTVAGKGCFISIWMPEVSLIGYKILGNEIYPDTAAHEMLHFLLHDYSFGEDSFSKGWGKVQTDHSKTLSDLLSPGGSRQSPRSINEAAPFGKLAQIRNSKILINQKSTKLLDVIFENTKYVKVERAETCRVSLSSSRILYQYPAWLPEPDFLVKFYRESLAAEGQINFDQKTEKANGKKINNSVPVSLKYTDMSQEHFNSNGGIFGGEVQTRDPVVYDKQIANLKASIRIDDMTNFSGGEAKGDVVIDLGILPSPFSAMYPLEKSSIDRTAVALQNNGRHTVTIQFKDIELPLADELKQYSLLVQGVSENSSGMKCKLSGSSLAGVGKMMIEVSVEQGIGVNNPDLTSTELRIPTSFRLIDEKASQPSTTNGWKKFFGW